MMFLLLTIVYIVLDSFVFLFFFCSVIAVSFEKITLCDLCMCSTYLRRPEFYLPF